eukprot:76019_1
MSTPTMMTATIIMVTIIIRLGTTQTICGKDNLCSGQTIADDVTCTGFTDGDTTITDPCLNTIIQGNAKCVNAACDGAVISGDANCAFGACDEAVISGNADCLRGACSGAVISGDAECEDTGSCNNAQVCGACTGNGCATAISCSPTSDPTLSPTLYPSNYPSMSP